MTTPQQTLLKADVAPLLRKRGFRRSGGTFRHIGSRGDVAFVSCTAEKHTHRFDIECLINVGIASAGSLASAGITPRSAGIADLDWVTLVRDPAFSPLDGNDRWRFDLDDAATRARLVTVLTMAADDVLGRLGSWPDQERDSLSAEPVFSLAVDRETRTRWFRDIDGRWDCLYSKLNEVAAVAGNGPDGPFAALACVHHGSLMVEITTAVADRFAGRPGFEDHAARQGFEGSSRMSVVRDR